jgi:hypothetical protein
MWGIGRGIATGHLAAGSTSARGVLGRGLAASPLGPRQGQDSPDHDVNDGEPWSEEDIRDLENHVRNGASLEETAEFLCRAGTVEAVAEKAKELGLIVWEG